MTRTATHKEQGNTIAATLLMSFELSDKTWKLGFTTGPGQKARERTVTARDQERVLDEIASAKRRVVYGYLTDNSRVGAPGKIASFHHPARGRRHGTELVVLLTPRGRSGVALSDHPCLVA